jgi:hypothetical protein
LGGKSCADFGKSGTGLKCTNCSFDPSGCADGGGQSGNTTITLLNFLEFDDFNDLVDRVINFIFMVGVVLAPLFYILAGFYFVTAAGEAQRVATAKNIMLYTTIGLGIILFARGLIAVLKSVIGG